MRETGPTYEFDVCQIDEKGYVFSTSKDQPVHMWNCENGKIVTQFTCRNQVEEVISPLAISSNFHNRTLLTGHNRGLLKLFDISRPD